MSRVVRCQPSAAWQPGTGSAHWAGARQAPREESAGSRAAISGKATGYVLVVAEHWESGSGRLQRFALDCADGGLLVGQPVGGGKPEGGWHILASLWETDGALPPMKKPVGNYNVWNKISKSEGTSL